MSASFFNEKLETDREVLQCKNGVIWLHWGTGVFTFWLDETTLESFRILCLLIMREFF